MEKIHIRSLSNWAEHRSSYKGEGRRGQAIPSPWYHVSVNCYSASPQPSPSQYLSFTFQELYCKFWNLKFYWTLSWYSKNTVLRENIFVEVSDFGVLKVSFLQWNKIY